MSTHHLIQYDVLKTCDQIAQAAADRTQLPEAREKRDQGVRVFFGGGTPLTFDAPEVGSSTRANEKRSRDALHSRG